MNIILLRTHRFGPREDAFLARLTQDSGWPAYVLADETRARLPVGDWPKISFSFESVRSLGLHWVDDAAWRCGDYGFYLARAAVPQATRFWLIEPDVRAGLPGYATLLADLDAVDADFLAPGLQASERSHFWYPTMRWRSPIVQRCHFAFCALRAGAADIALQERRDLARYWPARIFWPNDETFLASTLARRGARMADLDACGYRVWTPDSFGFFEPQHGESLPMDGLLHHPVLWGADYEAKAARVKNGLTVSERVRLKLLRGLAKFMPAPLLRAA